jgi:hypothetical protein
MQTFQGTTTNITSPTITISGATACNITSPSTNLSGTTTTISGTNCNITSTSTNLSGTTTTISGTNCNITSPATNLSGTTTTISGTNCNITSPTTTITSASTATGYLNVSVASGTACYIYSGTPTNTTGVFKVELNGANFLVYKDSGTGSTVLANNSGSGMVINTNNLTVTGTVTATSFTSTSDYRAKKDISPLSLEEYSIDKLNPVKFKFKSNNQDSIGLIAHELQEHIPFLVEGKKDGEMQSVNYMGLVGVLIKEVQELKNRVFELEKKIE